MVYFIYSSEQITKDTAINRKVGRQFNCGLVSIGSDKKEYSKIVLESDLNAMVTMYPDSIIIAHGKLNSFEYTDITEDYI